MDNDELVVHASKAKTFLLLGIAAAFTALGVYFLSLDSDVIAARDRFNNPVLIHGLGWVTVAFFGLGVVAAAWRLLSAKPGLILNNEGVRIFAMAQDTFLPWSDITGLAVFEVHRNKMLVLRVKNPEKYIRAGGPIRRSMARANHNLCGSPVAISASALKLSFRELSDIFEKYLARYSNAT